MKIIITCGPSYEPIDGARRMTNMSSGKLGVTLANYFADCGHTVICLRGEGSTFRGELRAKAILPFSTNDDLARQLELLGRTESIDAVFHAAALCDYRVEQVLNAAGEAMVSQKFATRDGRLHMVLAPATKVLPQLRKWFPSAHLVGWKYELAGNRHDAFAKAWTQLQTCNTDECVLNGAAYGSGFAVCGRRGTVRTCADTAQLCDSLFVSINYAPATRCS
jgi:phosphopantothenoylcysteine synthetase/decarboxylase